MIILLNERNKNSGVDIILVGWTIVRYNSKALIRSFDLYCSDIIDIWRDIGEFELSLHVYSHAPSADFINGSVTNRRDLKTSQPRSRLTAEFGLINQQNVGLGLCLI